MLIPIYLRASGGIIGLCRRGPFAGFLDLPVLQQVDASHDADGDILVRQGLRTRLTYDTAQNRYWAEDRSCLHHPDVEPFTPY